MPPGEPAFLARVRAGRHPATPAGVSGRMVDRPSPSHSSSVTLSSASLLAILCRIREILLSVLSTALRQSALSPLLRHFLIVGRPLQSIECFLKVEEVFPNGSEVCQ